MVYSLHASKTVKCSTKNTHQIHKKQNYLFVVLNLQNKLLTPTATEIGQVETSIDINIFIDRRIRRIYPMGVQLIVR
jgi:hypothetical protein